MQPTTVEKQSYATLLLASLTLLIVIPTLVVAVVTFVRVNTKECEMAGMTPVALGTPMPTMTPPTDKDDDHDDDEDYDGHVAPHGWGYTGDTGPAHWGSLDPDWTVCDTGRQQSPINIDTANHKDPRSDETAISRASFQNIGALAPNTFSYQVRVSHNGHTVSVGGSQEFFTKNGVWYKLAQFHFHTPSEHTIDGKYADGELHFVHQSVTGEYIVIGVMINIAEETPSWLQDVMAKMPLEEDLEGAAVEVNHEELLAGILGTAPSTAFWTYSGSFTTPPCTERVKWLVFQNSITMRLEDVNKLKEAEGANVRPVQPLNDRVVQFKPADPAPAAAAAPAA